ncbi:hypothetical protein BJV77DRAFT_1149121 [Russula vinacea]|nr:hypothetical protein BJV77DRAFT_1149121 [Russula vinacea]
MRRKQKSSFSLIPLPPRYSPARYTSDQRLTNWPNATVKVLYTFSGTLGQGVGHALSPACVVLSGIGVLLLGAKDVVNSQDVLIDILVASRVLSSISSHTRKCHHT